MTHRNKLDEFRIAHIAEQVRKLQDEVAGVILVVSGAVASGFNFLQFRNELEKRASAGIGQAVLTSTFQRIFASKKMQIAQVLLTREDLKSPQLEELLSLYLESGFIPMINENDAVSLNSFGGNDILASRIAALINADKLLILSTYDQSFFGVGGGETKQQALNFMKSQKIEARILDGKHKNILMEAIL